MMDPGIWPGVYKNIIIEVYKFPNSTVCVYVCMVWYGMVLYGMVLYGIVLYCIVCYVCNVM